MPQKWSCPFCENTSPDNKLFKNHLLTNHENEVKGIALRNNQTLNQTAGELAFIHEKENKL
jgi:hypothetical protein